MLQISYTSSGWVKLTSTKSCQIKGWLPDISTLNVTEYSPSLPSPLSLLSLPRPLSSLPSSSLPHLFFFSFFLANRHLSTPAHAHKHYPTAVPANCLCVLRPASLGINLWCNHGYRTTGNYKISSIFNVTLIMFECVLMEKGIEEMKQCSLHAESGGESLCLLSLTAWNSSPGKVQSILKSGGVPTSTWGLHQHVKYAD